MTLEELMGGVAVQFSANTRFSFWILYLICSYRHLYQHHHSSVNTSTTNVPIENQVR